ncbi:MAG: N-acetylmuramate alpha-1-phosphate uridylyltransferase MurU [Wenzhouxiangella sp.]
MRAMILAAGRGERLQPLTNRIPKPLIEVGGKPLIVRHLEALAAAGFSEVIINLAWLGDKIRAALGNGANFGLSILYSEEPPGALETAGAIVQALPRLGDQPFVVIAGDVLCDYAFDRLRPPTGKDLGHLVMVDNPEHHPGGDFALVAGRLRNTAKPRLTFSGIGVYTPALFADLAPGRRALRPVFNAAIAADRLSAEHHRGLWCDIGTAERLTAAQRLASSGVCGP